MATEYISREVVKSKKVYSVERHEFVVPVAEIDWIPPTDVVEVVRCKDCEFLKVGKVSMICAKGILSFIYPSDYCSRGKRRPNDA